MKIPCGPEEITHTWLKETFKYADFIDMKELVSFEVKPIPEQIGLLSRLYIIKLQYKKELDLPDSFIIKLATDNKELIITIKMGQSYLTEINFYRNHSKDLPVTIPRCYYADIDLESYDQILILEDLSAGKRKKSCSYNEAIQILDSMAALHSFFWNRIGESDLADIPNIFSLYDSDLLLNGFPTIWDAFQKRNFFEFDDDLKGKLDVYKTVSPQHVKHLYQTLPMTLLHGDITLNNIIFMTDDKTDMPIIIDWQLAQTGKCVVDVGLFILSSCDFLSEKEECDQFLLHYHEKLCEYGVKSYSYDSFLADFKVYLPIRLVTMMYETLNIAFDKKAFNHSVKFGFPKIVNLINQYQCLDL